MVNLKHSTLYFMKIYFLNFVEQFDNDDDDNNRRVINYNASIGQQSIPLDDVIATSYIPLDFETTVLKLMMSRLFRNRTRFKMSVRFVISQVR